MLYDSVDRGSIERLVRLFYQTLIRDEIVGVYFIRALGSDLKNDKWYEHLHTLDKFWMMVMKGEKGYVGDPLLPHIFLGEIPPQAFERWVEVFRQSANQLFEPPIANKFTHKAQTLANQFMEHLAMVHEDEED
jgi:hemoglobin